MEISVSLRVRGGMWTNVSDKTATLDMPVSEDDADWKETVKDKLQFFMQEAAEMLIPAVKKSIDLYSTPPKELEIGPASVPMEPTTQPEGSVNESDSISD